MDTLAYFEIPLGDLNTKSAYGGSPELLEKLYQHLEGAKEIHISFFLYNNPHLHIFLENLVSEKKCKVVIYTIPLEGYDSRPVKITHNNGRERKLSKREYANKIASRISSFEGMELRFMPHTNVWNKQYFSRGRASYGLHNKSIMVIKTEGIIECLSTSSNLALGDPRHSENVFVSKRLQEVKMFEQYFELLRQHSLTATEYDRFREEHEDFHYVTDPINLKDEYGDCYFSAPFIKYEDQGSNHYIQNKIINLIENVNKRLYICSQHFSDLNSFDKNAQSIVNAIGTKASQSSNIDIKILKQTRAKNQKQGKRTAETENFLRQFSNVQQKYWDPVIHDKFIIADNNLLITTANFTSTQFAWASPRLMEYEFNNEIHKVNNTFSDINSFHFLYEDRLAEKYNEHFQSLWERSTTVF
ncbi:hypothetical protein [Marinococcus luteus]|uniref:hypothetical protein n=1 Tax=Marinococcus luteus TaxID=1122204 RepID=UPI002ACC9ED1|nr:hypothetical protein [Marinococcus luteus]MDZ5781884.1 hypothetical protein [Marinococcus luteus]